jgi:hypothetical protein
MRDVARDASAGDHDEQDSGPGSIGVDARQGSTAADRTNRVAGRQSWNSSVKSSPHVAAMQQVAGNRATTRLLAPQSTTPASPPSPSGDPIVEKAVQSGDPNDIDAITDFTKVSEADRLRFIGILVPFQGDAHGRIPFIWQSFDDEQLARLMPQNRDLWDRSVSGFGGDPTVMLRSDLVDKIKGEYSAAIQKLATDNLAQNEKFVDTRMQEMGLKPGAAAPLSQDELTGLRHSLQAIAWNVWSLRQDAKKLTGSIIGVREKKKPTFGVISILMGGDQENVWFDPHQPPPEPDLQEVWRPMKDEWDRAQQGIATAAGDYPEIYQLVAAEDDDGLLSFSRATPEAFGAQQQIVLQTLLDRIKHVGEMVTDGQLDLMGLDLVEQRLAASGGEWGSGFKAYMAETLVKQHAAGGSTAKQIADLGLNVSLMLDVMGLPELGVVIGAVSAGLNLAVAIGESAQAGRQAEAARATPLQGTELVSRAKADEQVATATANEVHAAVLAIIAAIATGAVGAKALAESMQMARLRTILGSDEAISKLLPLVNGDHELLYQLGRQAGDAETLEALLGKVPPAQLGPLMQRVGSGPLTKSLLEHCGDVARLDRLLKRVPDAEQLDRLLAGTAPEDLDRLEQTLAKLGEPTPGSLSFNVGGELDTTADQIIINPGRQAMPIEKLRALRPDNLVIEARAEKIPFPDGCAKRISGKKLPNSIDWEQAAAEFKRLLAPGGRVDITVFGEGGVLRRALEKQGFALDPPPLGDAEHIWVSGTHP